MSVFLRFFERKRDGKREGGKRRGGWHDYRGVFFPLGRKLEEKRRNQRVLAQMDNNGRHDLDPCRGFTIALWKVTIGENSSRERGASRWKRKNHAGEEKSRYGRKQRAKINPLSSINQTSIDSNPRSHPPFNPFFFNPTDPRSIPLLLLFRVIPFLLEESWRCTATISAMIIKITS